MGACDSDGVRFFYPDDWELTRENMGRDVSFHLQSTGTGFWSLTLLESRPTAAEAVSAVVAALQEEYGELDIYQGAEVIADGPASACELDFVCLDLVNSAVIRAEITSEFTAVVMYQAEEREFDRLRGDFDAVTGSVQFSGDQEDSGN